MIYNPPQLSRQSARLLIDRSLVRVQQGEPYLSNTLDATCKKLHLKCFLQVNIGNLLDNCLILWGKMLTRFLAIPQMQTPFDTLFEQAQPDATKIFATPFLVSDRISKRAQLFQRVFRKLSYVNQPGFLWRSSTIRIPAFSFSKRALTFQHPFLSRSPITGRTAFLFSQHNIPCLKKGAGGNGG